MRASISLCLIVALSSVRGDATGQTLVPDEPSCAGCRITEREVVLLASVGAGPQGRPNAVTLDGRGRYWLTYPAGRQTPLIFDGNGEGNRRLG
jgi:hypothetical protein